MPATKEQLPYYWVAHLKSGIVVNGLCPEDGCKGLKSGGLLGQEIKALEIWTNQGAHVKVMTYTVPEGMRPVIMVRNRITSTIGRSGSSVSRHQLFGYENESREGKFWEFTRDGKVIVGDRR